MCLSVYGQEFRCPWRPDGIRSPGARVVSHLTHVILTPARESLSVSLMHMMFPSAIYCDGNYTGKGDTLERATSSGDISGCHGPVLGVSPHHRTHLQ